LFVDTIKLSVGQIPEGSISLVYYLIFCRNTYYTHCFPESRPGIWI